MTDYIPVPQPPLTPEQIAAGKDVEIRRLTARVRELEHNEQRLKDKWQERRQNMIAYYDERVAALAQERDKLDKLTTMQDGGIRMLHDQIAILTQERDVWEQSAGRHCEEHGHLKDKLDALTQAHQQALEAIYIPGSWTCTQCEFGQVITNLYVNSGTVGPNTDEVPICPNDGSLMRRCTWKERVKDDDKYITERLDEIDTLKAQLQQAVTELEQYKVHTDKYATPGWWHPGEGVAGSREPVLGFCISLEEGTGIRTAMAQLQQAVEALKQLATAVNEERLLVIGSEEWCVVASKMYDLAALATHKEKG